MSVNDSSRIFHPSAAQASPAAAAGPVQTSTTSAPPPTINTTSAPPTLPPRAAASPTTTTSPTHQTHPATTAVASALPTSPSSATHSTLSGGRDPSRVSSQSERSGRSVVVQDGLYPISAFVLKQGGAYQAYVTVRWTTSEGRTGVTERLGHSIGFNHVGSRSLRDKGVPEGAKVRLALEVLLGKHSEAHEEFLYDSRAMSSAFYVSRGTSLTLDKLKLVVADNDHEE
ncbi:hypothetical protein BDY24DRAFT_440394 [Mrakia frigida]|uniref:uncharacterized protein n=1 Tax=Mrakia frigida TaxID=29902 RepID=UPI003FCC1BB0